MPKIIKWGKGCYIRGGKIFQEIFRVLMFFFSSPKLNLVLQLPARKAGTDSFIYTLTGNYEFKFTTGWKNANVRPKELTQ